MPFKDPAKHRQAQHEAYVRKRRREGFTVKAKPGGRTRLVPDGAYKTYLGIEMKGHPTNAQRAELYAILDALPDAPQGTSRPKRVRPRPVPVPSVATPAPGPGNPAVLARILHPRDCDCRYCIEARYSRRFS